MSVTSIEMDLTDPNVMCATSDPAYADEVRATCGATVDIGSTPSVAPPSISAPSAALEALGIAPPK